MVGQLVVSRDVLNGLVITNLTICEFCKIVVEDHHIHVDNALFFVFRHISLFLNDRYSKYLTGIYLRTRRYLHLCVISFSKKWRRDYK